MTPAALIERARQGDRNARERISELLHDRVVRTAGRYASRTGMDRDDLQQEMWVGVMLGLQDVDPRIGDPLCYLYLRGKWRLLEAIRRSERERAEPLETLAATPDRAAFDEEVAARWLARRLAALLPQMQRTILEGLLQGYPQEELARRLGCSPANVSYHVRRIRDGYRALAAEG